MATAHASHQNPCPSTVIQARQHRTSTSLAQHPAVTVVKRTAPRCQVPSSSAACPQQQLPRGTVTQLLCSARSPRPKLWRTPGSGPPGRRSARSQSLRGGPGGSGGPEFRPAWPEASSIPCPETVRPSSHQVASPCSTICPARPSCMPCHLIPHACGEILRPPQAC